MHSPADPGLIRPFRSICVLCGSSDTAHPDYLGAAAELGVGLAEAGLRLVYGGGGVGLMGAVARAAHGAGGAVLGVMPAFLRRRELLYDEVETVVVSSMHERKIRMYDAADAFVVAPGGIGTLEEVVELLSWKRLDLHDKPIIFLNTNGFWASFFALMDHSAAEGMTPAAFLNAWDICATPTAVLERLATLREHQQLRYDQR